MRIQPTKSAPCRRLPRTRNGFTLPELMIASTILALVIAGVMYGHLVGLKTYELTKSKLGATALARKAINRLTLEVRQAKIVHVGDGDASSFSEATEGTLQQGNALRIFPGTNTNAFIHYYLVTNTSRLLRVENNGSGSASQHEVIAEFITNKVIFTSEDPFGNVLTNARNNRVVGLTLQFYQIQYPVTPIGPGAYFDYYQLRTRITRRTLE